MIGTAFAFCFSLLGQPALEFERLARPEAISTPIRLALTPQINDTLVEDQWLPYHADGRTFLQWEPGALHFAARLAEGEDLVLSLDGEADGWLVGSLNFEFRFRLEGNQVRYGVRRLRADNPNAPSWETVPFLAEELDYAVSPTASGWAIQATLRPIRLPVDFSERGRVGVRMDRIPSDVNLDVPFAPRAVTFVNLSMDASAGIPEFLQWNPVFRLRSMAPGDNIHIRHEFTRTSDQVGLVNAIIGGKERLEPFVAARQDPVPPFGANNRAALDYRSLLGAGAPRGYRVITTEINTPLGEQFTLMNSFRVTHLAEPVVSWERDLSPSDEPRVVRGTLELQSQVGGRLQGTVRYVPPSGWGVERGQDSRFSIFHGRTSQRLRFELIAPAGSEGVFPIQIEVTIGDVQYTETVMLPLLEPVDW